MKASKPYFQTVLSLMIVLVMIPCFSCSKQTAQKAGQGAAVGAAVSAVGGMVTALVFGGNVAEATARSAVYGASAGATAGAISGAMAESSAKAASSEAVQADMRKLRKTLGEDAFNGLKALVECKYDVAQAYGRTAAQSDNDDHALAGLWVQAIAYADSRDEGKARALFPDIVNQDDTVSSPDQAEAKMRESLQKLMDIRQENGLPPVCG